MLVLRGHTQFPFFALTLDRLQIRPRRRTPHIEEVLAHPLVPGLPTLAGSQVGQARLNFYALAQLRPLCPRRCLLAEQGQVQEGIAQMHQSQMSVFASYVLAEAYGKVGQVEEGLSVVAEALAFMDKTGMRVSEAELDRVIGQLTLQSPVESHQRKSKRQRRGFSKPSKWRESSR